MHRRHEPHMLYITEARHDVLMLVADLYKGQPLKYRMVLDQIRHGILRIPLEEPVGPEEA